jgi:hypothetical protein
MTALLKSQLKISIINDCNECLYDLENWYLKYADANYTEENHLYMRSTFTDVFNGESSEEYYNNSFKDIIINDDVKMEIIKDYEDRHGECPHKYQYDNGKQIILCYIAMISMDFVNDSYFCEKW